MMNTRCVGDEVYAKETSKDYFDWATNNKTFAFTNIGICSTLYTYLNSIHSIILNIFVWDELVPTKKVEGITEERRKEFFDKKTVRKPDGYEFWIVTESL